MKQSGLLLGSYEPRPRKERARAPPKVGRATPRTLRPLSVRAELDDPLVADKLRPPPKSLAQLAEEEAARVELLRRTPPGVRKIGQAF